jgi:hypothetical protein
MLCPPRQWSPQFKPLQSNQHPIHQTIMKRILLALPALAAALVFSSCESGPNAQTGTGVGALGGALAGGIIGHQSGHTAEGAVIGGVVGGAAGNAIGGQQDRRNGYYGNQPAYYDSYGRPVYRRY